ncbi:MAG: hypothetical protein H0X33_04415 [Taibaiella sp.]|nr:hypothetical protein [Taibaiella sp.]
MRQQKPILNAMNGRESNTLKVPSLVAMGAMCVLLLGAIVFYKERILFLDDAFIPFRIINLHLLQVQEHRYGSFITQCIPLLGSYMHWPLSVLLLAYSISFNAFYLAVVLLLIYKFRQYGMAILMALYYTLFVSDSFFWTNNEVHQGIAWMFLFFAVTAGMARSQRPLVIQIIGFIVLCVLSVFTHPLIMISMLYLWIFFMSDSATRPYNFPRLILFSIILMGIITAKFYISHSAGYDSDKLRKITLTSFSDVLHVFSGHISRTFLHYCRINYWWMPVIFITGLAAMLHQRRYIAFIATTFFAIALFIFICLTYSSASYDRHDLFYMEGEWMSLTIIIAAPFVFYFLPSIRSSYAAIFLSLIFITRFVYIIQASPVFTQRLETLTQAIDKMNALGLTKAVVIKDDRLTDKVLMDWGLPVETMMLSAINHKRPNCTLVQIGTTDTVTRLPHNNTGMIECFGPLKIRLNTVYFHFDSSTSYHILKYDDLFPATY